MIALFYGLALIELVLYCEAFASNGLFISSAKYIATML